MFVFKLHLYLHSIKTFLSQGLGVVSISFPNEVQEIHFKFVMVESFACATFFDEYYELHEVGKLKEQLN